MSHLYPIYLNLDSKRCLVVGGGKVAAGIDNPIYFFITLFP